MKNMDLFKEINKKINTINEYKEISGLNSVLSHIERSEAYLHRGKKESDDYLFTDVIYRTNHAFEGILNEAYIILAKKDASRKSPHQIEVYFNNNNIFNERVLDLFRNYRQNWRNPSTHDYTLIFSETEAFLAIISVSSFIHVLLDQIIESLSFESEQLYLRDRVGDIRDKIEKYEEISLFERIQELLLNFDFSKFNNEKKEDFVEAELQGAIHAYFKQIDASIDVNRRPTIESLNKKIGNPDFIIEKSNQTVIIEVKTILRKNTLKSGLSQLKNYLKYTQVKEGILFALSKTDDLDINNKQLYEVFEGFKIVVIIPKDLK